VVVHKSSTNINNGEMNNIVKITDLYITSIFEDGHWEPIPLSDGFIYQTVLNEDWSIHDLYVSWLKKFNNHPYITTTDQYKELYYSIKREGFRLDTDVTFKNVEEYLKMYDLCKLSKKSNWQWVIKDGQHRLSILLYFHKNALLEIDENHIVRRIMYG